MKQVSSVLPQSAKRRCVLSVAELYRADQAAEEFGVSTRALMENAGAAVSRAIFERWAPRPILVLCGPGNNGGDGYVIARHLADAGWPVEIAALGQIGKLPPDAAWHASQWQGEIRPLKDAGLEEAALVVDALFGAGLSRPLEGEVADLVQRINRSTLPVVSVDVPSGIGGDSSQPVGSIALQADLTVTFFRKKPAHLLYPGRGHCGEVRLADIGIPERVLDRFSLTLWENGPELWLEDWPWRRLEGHKYHAGHSLLLGGETMTGAARLAARAALRVGSGLVSLAASSEAAMVYRCDSPSLIVQSCDAVADLSLLLENGRYSAAGAGPGLGLRTETRDKVLALHRAGIPLVLDADALSMFSDRPEALFEITRVQPTILTPHDGEYRRLFGDCEGNRLVRAGTAARESGAVIVLKGPDTVIAAPDGRAVINSNAPAELATAGSGDVLTGLAVGLLAQGMNAFQAAAAVVWLQGEVAINFGPGLISEDIPEGIPRLLRRLRLHGRD
ncbi:bifunctional ADP-dependent NAD(P)H-hydrate dehydratase/NAD(P)H-hydrate epimerase [Fodinicurvata fenggangensis]|uniref:bifunctional ADP-dependent NAD(P)H-hydrate dehydratase/NAD(P)H-hydrate epimerase n=1 Tax=Fodinicurvata fenggangensis TaxID=1121830 RepID=UPI0006902E9C|nr:bifunctional ADP-dependent NAD(P)H-hydrate dehydratase/NAD(P)H-hydrate epimerase [Fodinicurvata fenggangensis]